MPKNDTKYCLNPLSIYFYKKNRENKKKYIISPKKLLKILNPYLIPYTFNTHTQFSKNSILATNYTVPNNTTIKLGVGICTSKTKLVANNHHAEKYYSKNNQREFLPQFLCIIVVM